MNEKPESLRLWEANDKQISDNKIYSLSVTHFREMITDPFKHQTERLLFKFYSWKSSFYIFFYLIERFMLN